jgi:2-polyprenyl-3-methyl-5-hydroxy-6-metoxy-1,4-benzoquinol methylase
VTAIDLWDGALFNLVQEAFGLNVRYVQKSIYELDATFGQFDLVVYGSLLLHLRDIFGAIDRIRSVCQGESIIAAAAMDNRQFDDKACCEFIGSKTIDEAGEYWVYWRLNAMTLEKMLLAAGFSKACQVSRFILESEPGRESFATAHIVVKAAV